MSRGKSDGNRQDRRKSGPTGPSGEERFPVRARCSRASAPLSRALPGASCLYSISIRSASRTSRLSTFSGPASIGLISEAKARCSGLRAYPYGLLSTTATRESPDAQVAAATLGASAGSDQEARRDRSQNVQSLASVRGQGWAPIAGRYRAELPGGGNTGLTACQKATSRRRETEHRPVSPSNSYSKEPQPTFVMAPRLAGGMSTAPGGVGRQPEKSSHISVPSGARRSGRARKAGSKLAGSGSTGCPGLRLRHRSVMRRPSPRLVRPMRNPTRHSRSLRDIESQGSRRRRRVQPRTRIAVGCIALMLAVALPSISAAAVPPYQAAPPAGVGTCSAAANNTGRLLYAEGGLVPYSFSESGAFLTQAETVAGVVGPDYAPLSQISGSLRRLAPIERDARAAIRVGISNYIEIEAPAAASATATTLGGAALRLAGLAGLTASTFLDSVYATWWLQDNDPCNLLAPAACPPGTVLDINLAANGIPIPLACRRGEIPTPTTPTEPTDPNQSCQTGSHPDPVTGTCVSDTCDPNVQSCGPDTPDPHEPRGPHVPPDAGGIDSPIPGQGHFIECVRVYWANSPYALGSGPGGMTPIPGSYAGSVCRGGGGGGWRWIPAY